MEKILITLQHIPGGKSLFVKGRLRLLHLQPSFQVACPWVRC